MSSDYREDPIGQRRMVKRRQLMGGLGEPHPGYSASAQKSRIPPKSMSQLWHRVQPICDIGCRALSSPRPSLPLLCTHPGKLAGKPGGSLFSANQEFKHASPSPREGTFIPTRAPEHGSKPTSFPYSLTPFSDLLATRLALPRGPQYVSQKKKLNWVRKRTEKDPTEDIYSVGPPGHPAKRVYRERRGKRQRDSEGLTPVLFPPCGG